MEDKDKLYKDLPGDMAYDKFKTPTTKFRNLPYIQLISLDELNELEEGE